MVKLQEMGEFVRSASSTIEAPVVRRLKEAFAGPTAAQDGRSGGRPACGRAAAAWRRAQAGSGPRAGTATRGGARRRDRRSGAGQPARARVAPIQRRHGRAGWRQPRIPVVPGQPPAIARHRERSDVAARHLPPVPPSPASPRAAPGRCPGRQPPRARAAESPGTAAGSGYPSRFPRPRDRPGPSRVAPAWRTRRPASGGQDRCPDQVPRGRSPGPQVARRAVARVRQAARPAARPLRALPVRAPRGLVLPARWRLVASRCSASRPAAG